MIRTGKVETILQAIATGQAADLRRGRCAKGDCIGAFVVRVRLDDEDVREASAGRRHRRRPRSSPKRVKPTHVIRKVLLRQIAILNYVNPF